MNDEVADYINDLNSRDYYTRVTAAQELGDLADSRTVPDLIARLSIDPSSEVRASAAEALGKLGDILAARPLIQYCLLDSDRNVQLSAIWALGEFGDSSSVSKLEEIWYNAGTSCGVVREGVLIALVKIGSDNGFTICLQGLGDPYSGVRGAAARELALFEDLSAVPYLIAALHDPSRYVRQRAVEALGHLGDAGVIDELKIALEDSEIEVRHAAHQAIIRLESMIQASTGLQMMNRLQGLKVP